MDKNRLWMIGSILVMALVVAGGWVVGIQPQLAAIADAATQKAAVDDTNARNVQVLAQLKKESADLPALKAKLAQLAASVPDGSSIPSFTDQLNALYTSSNVICVDQAFADAVAYKPVTPVAAPPASGATSSSSPSPSPTPAVTPAPAPTAAPAGVPPVANALITSQNFAAQPVTITVRGQYADILNFVHGLQTGPRLFLVTALSTAPTTGTNAAPGSLDGKIAGYIYSLTSSQAQAASAAGTTSSGTTAEASK
ncbi:hypothetical protein [Leifsonia sp. fls2-241-R2A-40a]|uniref:hypothetical protein n=1 Tax=Leifsonia sp. fls2-241-R2A-40a TaxID=3040290 RepID=UPI00254F6651|nr:hypothetical protein [Leifsonia sp. fls2-241-R2A-40a]